MNPHQRIMSHTNKNQTIQPNCSVAVFDVDYVVKSPFLEMCVYKYNFYHHTCFPKSNIFFNSTRKLFAVTTLLWLCVCDLQVCASDSIVSEHPDNVTSTIQHKWQHENFIH